MVVQKTFNNLKAGPKEDKVAVASGIAISVVIVLLGGWAIYFLHSIQTGSQQLKLGGGAQSQFNFQNVTEAQQQLQQDFGSQTQDLQDVQAQSAQGNSNVMQTQPMQVDGSYGADQFGGSGSTN
jgi:preprotein translocase subunit SecF